MQVPPGSSRNGVVQWVIPPSAKPKKVQGSRGPIKLTSDKSSSFKMESTAGSEDQQLQNESPVIDMSMCRTICTFVDEHLRELHMHQRLIDKARPGLANSNLQNLPELADSSFIARSDLLKLKVRDQQTKAIATIKQLTNYLRELARLKRLCDSSPGTTDEETITKLSDIRSDIIQALNDFVLSNHDIDMPIIDPDDFTQNGYDLCADATIPVTQDCIVSERKSPETREKIKFMQNRSPLGTSSLQNDASSDEQLLCQSASLSDQKLLHCEMRQREIQKIERDTVALRQLFTEFYNLVRAQDEQIDSIEDNIVITTHRIADGHQNINKSVKKLTILVTVSGCMAGALIGGPVGIAVGGKLGCITLGFASSLLGLLSSYTAQRHINCNRNKDD